MAAASRLKKPARGPVCVAAEPFDARRPDSAALAAAFRSSDAAAAKILAEQLLPMVTRLVRRLMAWSDDADDLVQDVLVTALAKRKSFHGQASLETWITRIAINQCRAHQRKRWLRERLLRAWAQQGEPRSTQQSQPVDFALAGERAAAVRAAVARLPARSREAIVLCYLEGMSVAEAAKALVVRPGTLEVRLSRARQQLREALTPELDDLWERPRSKSE